MVACLDEFARVLVSARVRVQVQDVSTMADTAKGILRTIQARAVTNKIVLGIIIFLLLAIDIVLIYIFYIRK